MKGFAGFVARAAVAGLAWTSACAISAGAPDPERLAEARALLADMQVDKQFDNMVGVMADGIAKQVSQGKPGVNRRLVQVTMEESMRAMKEQMLAPGGIRDSMAEAYALQFTLAELRQIHGFYASPAGQHMLQASPELMKEIFPRVMESARAATPRVCALTKARLLAEKAEGAEAMKCPAAP